MRKEKVCLGLFNVLVKKKISKCFCSWQALLAQRSVLTSVSSGSWSGVTFDIFAVSGSGGQDASWRRIGSEQCSHPCPTKKAVVHLRSLQHESPAAWPGAWQGLITAWNQSTGPSSSPFSYSGFWNVGEKHSMRSGNRSPRCACCTCVCGYMSMIGVWVHDVCQGACACVWRLP